MKDVLESDDEDTSDVVESSFNGSKFKIHESYSEEEFSNSLGKFVGNSFSSIAFDEKSRDEELVEHYKLESRKAQEQAIIAQTEMQKSQEEFHRLLSEKNAELAALRKSVGSTSSQNGLLGSDRSHYLEEELVRAKQALVKASELDKQLALKDDQIAQLQKCLDDLRREQSESLVSKRKSEDDNTILENARLTQDNAKLFEELAELKSTFQEVSKAKDSLKEELAESLSQMQQLEAKDGKEILDDAKLNQEYAMVVSELAELKLRFEEVSTLKESLVQSGRELMHRLEQTEKAKDDDTKKHQSTIEELRTEKESLAQSVGELKHHIEQTEQAKDDDTKKLQSTIEELTKEKEPLVQSIKDLQHRLEQNEQTQTKDSEELHRTIEELKKEKVSLSKSNEEHQSQLQSVERAKDQATNRVLLLETEIQNEKLKNGGAISDLSERLKHMSKEKESAEHLVAELQTRLEEIQSDKAIDPLKNEAIELKCLLQQTQLQKASQEEELQQVILKLQSDSLAKEEEIKKLSFELENTSAARLSEQEELNRIKLELHHCCTEKSSLDAEFKRITLERDNFLQARDALQLELRDLETRLQDSVGGKEEELKKLSFELQNTSAARLVQQEELNRIKLELQCSCTEKSSLDEECKRILLEHQIILQEKEALQQGLSRLETKLHDSLGEKESLQEKLQSTILSFNRTQEEKDKVTVELEELSSMYRALLNEKELLQVKSLESENALSHEQVRIQQLLTKIGELEKNAQFHASEAHVSVQSSQQLTVMLEHAFQTFVHDSGTSRPVEPHQQLSQILQVLKNLQSENASVGHTLSLLLMNFFGGQKGEILSAVQSADSLGNGVRSMFQHIQALEQEKATIESNHRTALEQVEASKAEALGLRRRIGDLEEENIEFRKKWSEATKKERTIAQLQAVIDQMRELTSKQTQEIEAAQKKIEDLQKLVESQAEELWQLRSENTKNRGALSAIETQSQESQAYKQKFLDLEKSMHHQATEWKAKENELLQQITELQNKQAGLKQELYETGIQWKAAQADLLVVREDIDRRDTALLNLQKVLEQFQLEKQAETCQIEKRFEDRLKAQEEASKAKEATLQQLHNSVLQESKDQFSMHQEKYCKEMRRLEAEILRRDQDYQNVRHALDEAVSRLHTPENSTTVDKQLIVNLLIKLVSSNKSKEVLELIAKLLDLTEAERRQLGLNSARMTKGMFGSFMSLIGPASHEPVEVQGENLSDMWANFLISEAEGKRNNK